MVLPVHLSYWRIYFFELELENQIRAIGAEFLDIVLLTCDLQWTEISFQLDSSAPEGQSWPQLKVISEVPKDKDAKNMTTEEMQRSLSVLGIQLPYRASLVKDIMYELLLTLDPHDHGWEGKHISFKRETNDMSALVQMSFQNEEKTVYALTISPEYGTINPRLLLRVNERASTLRDHDQTLRSLLSLTPTIFTDLKNGFMRFVLPDTQNNFDIPFDVIGSYSKQHSTWCWSWANDSYTDAHHEMIRQVRDQSSKEHFPEENLFNTSIINCENLFAFSIAHMCAYRMKEKTVLVYPLGSHDPNFPRVFLALKVPDSILARMNAPK